MSSIPERSLRRLPGTTLLLIAALASSIFACASGPRIRHQHEYTLAPGREHQPALGRALLLPIGWTDPEPVKGLDRANDRIAALIAAHLSAKGIEVERANPHDLRRVEQAARRAVAELRKSGAASVVAAEIGFGDVVPEILKGLDSKADLVIAADVVMRGASYQGTRTIVWDGVRRRETVNDATMSGSNLPAASVRGQVFAKSGERVFMGYGGLEPVFRIDPVQTKYVLREDFLEDERNLKEGICIAFYPYFGVEEFCSR